MTTQPATPQLMEVERPPSTIEDVLAGILRNVAGGAAIGGLTWIILTATPLDWPTINEWAARVTGAGIFAALIVYGLGDDTWNLLKRRELAADLGAAQEAIDWADDELAAGRVREHDKDVEISRLKAQLAYYQRSRNYTPAVPEQSDPIMDDARKLIDLRYKNGSHPSRRYMNQFGWADDRHAAAMSLLASRGVVAIGQGNSIRWLDSSAPPAIAKLVADKSYLEAGALVSPAPPEGEGL